MAREALKLFSWQQTPGLTSFKPLFLFCLYLTSYKVQSCVFANKVFKRVHSVRTGPSGWNLWSGSVLTSPTDAHCSRCLNLHLTSASQLQLCAHFQRPLSVCVCAPGPIPSLPRSFTQNSETKVPLGNRPVEECWPWQGQGNRLRSFGHSLVSFWFELRRIWPAPTSKRCRGG